MSDKEKKTKQKYNGDEGKPVVNVNVNCCDDKKESAKPSGFRAVNATADQTVTADIPVIPVLYPDEIFDLNNEYDPVTSTFIPKQDGVYLVIASVNFIPPVVNDEIVQQSVHIVK